MKFVRWLVALSVAGAGSPLLAGPPYLTDDPVPTDTGHWELYAFTAGEGLKSSLDASFGVDMNFGPVEGVQLTATLPVSFSHEPLRGWRSGSGDIELGVKYRFIHERKNGFSAAIFPRAILPTAALTPREKMRFLLPLWIGKDFAGGTSIFGGGGYTINPGGGNHDFWQAAIALTQDVSKRLSVGAEITRQGADVVGRTGQTRAGVGGVVQLSDHYALLFSGGPTWADHQTSYRFYAALGLNF